MIKIDEEKGEIIFSGKDLEDLKFIKKVKGYKTLQETFEKSIENWMARDFPKVRDK